MTFINLAGARWQVTARKGEPAAVMAYEGLDIMETLAVL